MTLEAVGGRTWMTILSTFEGGKQPEQVLATGMEEDLKEAVGQIDAVLAGPPNSWLQNP